MSYRTIEFEDKGQDFLEWDVDENDVVIECRPCQASIWCGETVAPQTVKIGLFPTLTKNGLRTLRHRIEKVSGWKKQGVA